MWLYMLGAFLLVVGIVGGIATGGIFTLVFIPLGIIALVSAAAYSMWGRAASARAGGGTAGHATTAEPLPHSRHGDPGHVASSPEALADARRVEQ
jgi:hypothetical protein